MIEESIIKHSLDQASQGNSNEITKVLNEIYEQKDSTSAKCLFQSMVKSEYSYDEEKKIIRSFLNAIKDWRAGFYSYANFIFQLLQYGGKEKTLLKQYVVEILYSDIQSGKDDLSYLVTHRLLLQFFLQEKNQEFIMLILEKCTQHEFNKICALIVEKKYKESALTIKNNPGRFKFNIPQPIIDLTNNKIPSSVPVEAESEVQLLLKSHDETEYLKKFEIFMEKRWEFSLPYQCYQVQNWSSIYIEESRKVIADAAIRHKNCKFEIAKVKDKKLLLTAALHSKEEIFAHAIATHLQLSVDEIAWLAIKHKCNKLLKLVLENGAIINLHKNDIYNNNWLHHVASYGNFEAIKIIVQAIGDDNIKQLINEQNYQKSTPVHYAATQPTEQLDQVLALFSKLGGDFTLKNLQGLTPPQYNTQNSCDENRIKIFAKHGIKNRKTLQNAIGGNDVHAVKEGLQEESVTQIRLIFNPRNEIDDTPVPRLTERYASRRRSYFDFAIFHGYAEVVKVLVNFIKDKEIFSTNELNELLNNALSYAKEVIKNLGGKNTIVEYIEGVLKEPTPLPPNIYSHSANICHFQSVSTTQPEIQEQAILTRNPANR